MKSYVSFIPSERLSGVYVKSSLVFIGGENPPFLGNFSAEKTDTGGFVSSFDARTCLPVNYLSRL